MMEVITMARRKRTPEENARREKIRELLQLANVGSMDDIQELFKDTIAEFRGVHGKRSGGRAGRSAGYACKNKNTDNSRNGHSSKTLRTSFGDVEVSVPRDRKSEFAPRCCGKSDQHQPGHRGYFHCLYGQFDRFFCGN